jgi:hypothetical protein
MARFSDKVAFMTDAATPNRNLDLTEQRFRDLLEARRQDFRPSFSISPGLRYRCRWHELRTTGSSDGGGVPSRGARRPAVSGGRALCLAPSS